MDAQQIFTSVASALVVLILSGIFGLIRGWIKKTEQRELQKERRMLRYFRKTDAILYAFIIASDKIIFESIQRAYTEKLEDLEKEDAMMEKSGKE